MQSTSRCWLSSTAVPFAPTSPFAPSIDEQPKVVARASTLKLVDKSSQIDQLSPDDPHAIPKGSHWADETEEGTILVIEQPSTQTCAAVGGIMASRMKVRGLRGCAVSGRVRDLAELKKSGLPVSLYLPTSGSYLPHPFRLSNYVLALHAFSSYPSTLPTNMILTHSPRPDLGAW